MARKFETLADFALHRERSRLELAQQEKRLQVHWQAVQDGRFRKALVKNSVAHWVEGAAESALRSGLTSGPALAGVGAATWWGLRKKHPAARWLSHAAWWLVPKWLSHRAGASDHGSRWTRELRTSWDRVRRFRAQQNAERTTTRPFAPRH